MLGWCRDEWIFTSLSTCISKHDDAREQMFNCLAMRWLLVSQCSYLFHCHIVHCRLVVSFDGYPCTRSLAHCWEDFAEHSTWMIGRDTSRKFLGMKKNSDGLELFPTSNLLQEREVIQSPATDKSVLANHNDEYVHALTTHAFSRVPDRRGKLQSRYSSRC